MRRAQKITMLAALILLLSCRTAEACPFCLLGMYEAHIANFGNYVMNILPVLTPVVTGIILYWRAGTGSCGMRNEPRKRGTAPGRRRGSNRKAGSATFARWRSRRIND